MKEFESSTSRLQSTAIKFLDFVWNHKQEATGHSWHAAKKAGKK